LLEAHFSPIFHGDYKGFRQDAILLILEILNVVNSFFQMKDIREINNLRH